MKVLFLPRWFPVPDDPLWGLFVLNHARAAQTYHDVYVLYTDKTQSPGLAEKSPWITEINGVPVCYNFYSSSSFPVAGRFITFVRMLIAWHKGWRFVVENRGVPDLNHVHILTRMGVLAWWLKKKYGIPYVITEHWSRYLPMNLFFKGWLRKSITRRVVRDAGALMPVTNNLATAMKGFGLVNTLCPIIPNTIDAKRFEAINPKPPAGKLVMVHISTFDDRAKNISGILRVAEKLKASGYQFLLRLIGDGKDYASMKSYSDKLGLDFNTVCFEGAAVPERIPEILASSHVLVLFSNYENIPVVINEAFAAGLPVVATRVGGIAEVINDKNGILINPGDEEGLFNALASLIKSGVEQFSADIIRRKALEEFSFEAVGSKLSEVYKIATQKRTDV